MSVPTAARSALALALLSLLGGCGGGSSDDGSEDRTDAGASAGAIERPSGEGTGEETDGGAGGWAGDGGGGTASMPILSDPVVSSAALDALRDDPDRIAGTPSVALVERVEGTGVEVAYTDPAQRERAPALSISSQWEAMQSCVGIGAPPPLVFVVGTVRPFFRSDDVLPDPFVGIVASAGANGDGLLFIQVHESAFDAERDDPGFPMRWIMTRHLWASDARPERDIPFLCARGGREGRP